MTLIHQVPPDPKVESQFACHLPRVLQKQSITVVAPLWILRRIYGRAVGQPKQKTGIRKAYVSATEVCTLQVRQRRLLRGKGKHAASAARIPIGVTLQPVFGANLPCMVIAYICQAHGYCQLSY